MPILRARLNFTWNDTVYIKFYTWKLCILHLENLEFSFEKSWLPWWQYTFTTLPASVSFNRPYLSKNHWEQLLRVRKKTVKEIWYLENMIDSTDETNNFYIKSGGLFWKFFCIDHLKQCSLHKFKYFPSALNMAEAFGYGDFWKKKV